MEARLAVNLRRGLMSGRQKDEGDAARCEEVDSIGSIPGLSIHQGNAPS